MSSTSMEYGSAKDPSYVQREKGDGSKDVEATWARLSRIHMQVATTIFNVDLVCCL